MWWPMMSADANWGWWMFFGGLWMLLFWGGIIGVVVWSIGKLVQSNRLQGDDPLDIAKKRYARGEINKEQLEEIRHNIG